ncbi:hypothetical protein [[Kitasatospora] papulosa]
MGRISTPQPHDHRRHGGSQGEATWPAEAPAGATPDVPTTR